MTSSPQPQTPDDSDLPADPQLTEVVAYLDGELDESSTEIFEKRLAGDEDLRQYAETLDRTWQMLSALGEAPASGQFTQKTLASVEAVSATELQTTSRSRLRSLSGFPLVRCAAWLLIGFLGAGAGLLFSRASELRRTNADDIQLLKELDLLQEYQKIRSVPDAEFLKQLSGNRAGVSP